MSSDNDNPFASYEESWEYIYGPEGIAPKASEWFAKQFPDGHTMSIRPLAEHLLEKMPEADPHAKRTSKACVFHPRALKLLVQYGRDYMPDLRQAQNFHEKHPKPRAGQCFINSWWLMHCMNKHNKGLVYVEGLTVGYLVKPILHAWVSYGLEDNLAVDWTQYPGCPWNRYLGIAVTEEEHIALQAFAFPGDTRQPIALLDIEHFPLIEEPLAALLAARERPAV